MFKTAVHSFLPFSQSWFLFAGLFLATIACDLQQQQNNSQTNVNESAVDVRIISRDGDTPLVFLKSAEQQICRRGIPPEGIYGLDPRKQDEGDGGAQAGQGEQEETSTRQAITESVGENWFRMGLEIVNKNSNYWLVVDQLELSISAPWGDKLLTGTSNLSSSYCQTDPLYIIPPTRRTGAQFDVYKYEPEKTDHLNNLTLYISGVPIPDAPPNYRVNEDGGLGDIRATAQDAAGTAGAPPQAEEVFVLTRLPRYRVQMVLYGHWIDKSRNYIANFQKKVNFSIASRFLN